MDCPLQAPEGTPTATLTLVCWSSAKLGAVFCKALINRPRYLEAEVSRGWEKVHKKRGGGGS